MPCRILRKTKVQSCAQALSNPAGQESTWGKMDPAWILRSHFTPAGGTTSVTYSMHATGAVVLTGAIDANSFYLSAQTVRGSLCMSKRTGFQMHSNIGSAFSQQITLTSALRLSVHVCWSKQSAWLPNTEQTAWRNILEVPINSWCLKTQGQKCYLKDCSTTAHPRQRSPAALYVKSRS